MILITVKFPIRPDRMTQWEALSADYAAAVSAEPGCVFFEFSRSVADPNEFVCIEGFRDQAAGEEHMRQAHVTRFMAEMPDIVSAYFSRSSPASVGWARVGRSAPGRVKRTGRIGCWFTGSPWL